MRKNNRGFTLVELVVSIALLALILVPTVSFFTSSFKVQSKSSMKTSITRVSQYLMENFKNKNYLGFTIIDEHNNARELEDYVDKNMETMKTKLNSENIKITDEDGWLLPYNNVEYNVHLELTELQENDISNIDIPKTFDGYLTMNSTGFGNFDNSYINIVDVGGKFESPYNGDKEFFANYPTLILKDGYQNKYSDGKATLLITNDSFFEDVADENEYYNGKYENGYDKQKYIRIVKGFEDELEVYIEGINVLIKKGQEGDGAPKEYTKITSSYIGEISDDNKERSSSEVILKAKMTISYATDESLRDTFEFSFPVNYDYE